MDDSFDEQLNFRCSHFQGGGILGYHVPVRCTHIVRMYVYDIIGQDDSLDVSYRYTSSTWYLVSGGQRKTTAAVRG